MYVAPHQKHPLARKIRCTVIRDGFDRLNQHRPSLRSESDVSFKPVDDKADDEALRDWESEGGAVPASSLPTPS
jgi:hypothetical protein